VRATDATPDFLGRVRQFVHEVDPNVPILEARTLLEQTSLGFALYDATARVLGVVGLAAVGLAALGIYGLVAYTVKQSAHEIGVRMAIGASRTDVARRYLMTGLRLALVGTVIGLTISLAGARVMKVMLYGVEATDLLSFASATALVLGVALAASFLPAWRAARVNPLTSLRRL
jgi:ABC-type antimicrobial peptide transport system permease subunit